MNKCYVLGGANIDIMGKSVEKMIPYDSNLAKISLSFGGVARNIAENISLNGLKVYFKTVFADDILGKMLVQKCLDDGFDLTYSEWVHDGNTSIYLALLDHENDMVAALNDMSLLSKMDLSGIKNFLDDLHEEDWLIFDTNLEQSVMDYIVENKHYHLALDPISVAKSYKIKGYLMAIDCLKPNRYEACFLSGLPLEGPKDYKPMLEYFKNEGVKEVLITLSKEGVLYYDHQGFYRVYTTDEIDVVNATGAGDAFFGNYIAARLRDETMEEAVLCGMAAAQLTMGTHETVGKEITQKTIKNKIKSMKWIKEKL